MIINVLNVILVELMNNYEIKNKLLMLYLYFFVNLIKFKDLCKIVYNFFFKVTQICLDLIDNQKFIFFRYRVLMNGSLAISSVQINDTGMFQCLASNPAGETSSYTWLKIKSKYYIHYFN